jgi:uncharacterized protein (TIGR03435 family)
MKRLVAVVACFAMILGLPWQLVAQSPAGPVFEVVSIKPSNPDAAGTNLPPVGGRYTASSVSLRTLVQIAYEVSDSQIDGGPEWQTSRRFDIQAKAATPIAGLEAMLPMLKTLLADRFQLKVHTETREMPIYTLVTSGKNGQARAKMTPSTANCSNAEQDVADASARDRGFVADRLQAGNGLPCAIMPGPRRAPGSMTMRGNAATMAELARFLQAATGRKVQDRTDLTGRYDWEMTFEFPLRPQTVQQPGSNSPLATPPPDSQPLTTALQEQLGLRLEPARGPVEILVIDSAALPTAN